MVSQNQSGGITAGTVNINAAPEPELESSVVFENRPVAEGYHTRAELVVDSPYPPANLRLIVHAPTILRIQLRPQRTGVAMYGHSGLRPGLAFTNLKQPEGRLSLDIFTREPERCEVEWSFD